MNRRIAVKTIIILTMAILLTWSLTVSVLWIKESRENRNNYLMQINDFHGDLILFDGTMDNLLEITTVVREDNSSDQEQKLLTIAIKNELGDLERTWSHINVITSRIDPTRDNFAKEYSIRELLDLIHNIDEVTREILKNEPLAQERLDRLNELLSSSATELDFVYNVSISSTDFQNKLKQYIDSMNIILSGI